MRYECEMIAPIKSCLSEELEESIFLQEFSVGYGVADLIAVQPNKKNIDARLSARITGSIQNYPEIQVVLALKNYGESGTSFISNVTGISEARLRADILKYLIRINIVKVSDANSYSLCQLPTPISNEIWAVEAKLNNWTKGYCQAKRYQHFANRSFLAILDKYRHRVDDSVLKRNNIGLITVSNTGACIVFRPRKRRPSSDTLSSLSNEFIWNEIQLVT